MDYPSYTNMELCDRTEAFWRTDRGGCSSDVQQCAVDRWHQYLVMLELAFGTTGATYVRLQEQAQRFLDSERGIITDYLRSEPSLPPWLADDPTFVAWYQSQP